MEVIARLCFLARATYTHDINASEEMSLLNVLHCVYCILVGHFLGGGAKIMKTM